MTVEVPPGNLTFQEMYAMYQSPEFRQPAEMCIRRQASFQSMSDKPVNVALANGVLSNSSMDIEALMGAVSTDPEGNLTIGNDDKMFEIVEKVWPLVATARYPGIAGQPAPATAGATVYDPAVAQEQTLIMRALGGLAAAMVGAAKAEANQFNGIAPPPSQEGVIEFDPPPPTS